MDETATLNIFYAGQNGDLQDQVLFDSSDEEVRRIATEAVRSGGTRGLDAHPDASFEDFVVDRVSAHDGLPNRLLIRPKTPFGVTSCDACGKVFGERDYPVRIDYADPAEEDLNQTKTGDFCPGCAGDIARVVADMVASRRNNAASESEVQARVDGGSL